MVDLSERERENRLWGRERGHRANRITGLSQDLTFEISCLFLTKCDHFFSGSPVELRKKFENTSVSIDAASRSQPKDSFSYI